MAGRAHLPSPRGRRGRMRFFSSARRRASAL
jgi:hypothetical protein